MQNFNQNTNTKWYIFHVGSSWKQLVWSKCSYNKIMFSKASSVVQIVESKKC